MKTKLLISSLLLPLGAATLAAVTSCNSPKQHKTIDNEEKENEPLTSSTVTVNFVPKEGEESKVTWVGQTTVKAKVGRQFSTLPQPLAYKNKYVVTYWTRKTTEGEYVRIPDDYVIQKGDEGLKIYPYFENDIELGDCMGLAAIQNSTISIVNHGTTVPHIAYSRNGIKWDDYEDGEVINVNAGEVVYFRGNNYDEIKKEYYFSTSETDYTSFSIGGSVSLTGNVMTLLDDGKGKLLTIPTNYCFYKLFEGCSGIVSISSNFLPATTLKKYCYAYMFSDCSRLTDFPKSLLPATDLFTGSLDGEGNTCCYAGMFMDCIGLKTIPTTLLNASTLSMYCYYSMFSGCDGLTHLDNGILSKADNLEYGCYYAMFSDCDNLATLGNNLLPAQHLAPRCYASMFSLCDKLIDASSLVLGADIASVVTKYQSDGAYNCYDQMFYGCEYLEKAPVLQSTTLAKSCYESMFYNCYKLTDAGLPELNATTLAPYCYRFMFFHCHALTTIPTLSATTLADYCYYQMFAFCDNIGKEGSLSSVSLAATTLAPHCYDSMFQSCKSMTVAPAFPTSGTVNLAPYCFESMFMDCVALTSSRNLIATTAADGCYMSMYSGCKGLTSTGLISLKTFKVDDTVVGEYACYLMFNSCENLWVGDDSTGSEWSGYDILIVDPTAADDGFIATGAFDHIFQGTHYFKGSGGMNETYTNSHKWGYRTPAP